MQVSSQSKVLSPNKVLTVIGRILVSGDYKRCHIEGYIATTTADAEGFNTISFETVIDQLLLDGISEKGFMSAMDAAMDYGE